MSIEKLNKLPEISFVDKSVENLLTTMVSEYETAYYQSTGQKKTLASGDPIRIWIYAQALRIYAVYQMIDYSAKQNLLKYASGAFLENLGARIGVTRLPAAAAVATQRFYISVIQKQAVVIPQGTRVSTGSNIFFATTDAAKIAPGAQYVDVRVECTDPGSNGNNFTSGQINTLVDPIAFIERTENQNTSQGGSDDESDESLRERIFLKPESFSVAGPKDAYVYFVKEYSADIEDVNVISQEPGVVDVRFLLNNGQLPDAALIDGVNVYLSDDKRRPLTDKVRVQAPDKVGYDLNFTYYVRSGDKEFLEAIKKRVANAVDDYLIWQRSKIGRDINPSELIYRVINAGAKRVVVTSPVYTALSDTQVASVGTVNPDSFGGPEDE